MAITAQNAYELFRIECGRAMVSNQMAVKRQVLPNWDNLAQGIRDGWASVVSVARLDGAAAHAAFEVFVDATTFSTSILSTSKGDVVFIPWDDLLPQVQAAWGAVALETGGPDLVINGDFATDSDWATGLGWSIANGEACCDGAQLGNSDLAQSTTLEVGQVYMLNLVVKNYVAGTLTPTIGGDTGLPISADGTFSQQFTTVSTGSLVLKADVDFVGCVDSVSLRKV